MYSFFGSALIPSYSAAKGAIIQLTKSLAIEFALHNIQVNAIAPGWIETDMTAPVRTEAMKAMNDEIIARTPAGRWGSSRGCCWDSRVPGLGRLRLRYGRDRSGGRRLRYSITRTSGEFSRSPRAFLRHPSLGREVSQSLRPARHVVNATGG